MPRYFPDLPIRRGEPLVHPFGRLGDPFGPPESRDPPLVANPQTPAIDPAPAIVVCPPLPPSFSRRDRQRVFQVPTVLVPAAVALAVTMLVWSYIAWDARMSEIVEKSIQREREEALAWLDVDVWANEDYDWLNSDGHDWAIAVEKRWQGYRARLPPEDRTKLEADRDAGLRDARYWAFFERQNRFRVEKMREAESRLIAENPGKSAAWYIIRGVSARRMRGETGPAPAQ